MKLSPSWPLKRDIGEVIYCILRVFDIQDLLRCAGKYDVSSLYYIYAGLGLVPRVTLTLSSLYYI
jgi:hypothetical protein